jgi:hypothetical protein
VMIFTVKSRKCFVPFSSHSLSSTSLSKDLKIKNAKL